MQLLARALAEVPPTRLESIFHDRARPGDIGAKQDEAEESLRSEVEKFCSLARQGHFHETIPYRGSEQSRGTHEFVARCNVLFDRCVAEGEQADPRDIRVALETLMDLMRRIDDGGEDIVYFTDEAGSWQVGVIWEKVLPAYFKCLARTATESEFGAAVDRALADFAEHGSRTRPELRQAAEDAWSAGERV